MRFVARLASSPRVTTLELPRPSTRGDPLPSVDPPPTAAALDLSDALDDDGDADRDGLGFFARAPASSRRRPAGTAEKAHPQKSASPSRASSRAPTRVRARARAPTSSKSNSSLDDDDDDAIARRRLASPRATVARAHAIAINASRATSLRSSDRRRRAPRATSPDSRRARVSGSSPTILLHLFSGRRRRRDDGEKTNRRPRVRNVRMSEPSHCDHTNASEFRVRARVATSPTRRARRASQSERAISSARARAREAIRARATARDTTRHERCLDEVKENPRRRRRADPPRRACNSRSAGSRAT